jgi:hypothetical protein
LDVVKKAWNYAKDIKLPQLLKIYIGYFQVHSSYLIFNS